MNDTGTYTVDGDKLIYSPFSGGQNRYLWRIVSDRLMLEFVGSTEDPDAGLPAEVINAPSTPSLALAHAELDVSLS